MQLQRHEQHMMTVFYLLSSQMKSTRIEYSRLKRSRNANFSQLSLAPGCVRACRFSNVAFRGACEEFKRRFRRKLFPQSMTFCRRLNKMAAARTVKLVARFAEEFTSFREKAERTICEGLVLIEFSFNKARHLVTISKQSIKSNASQIKYLPMKVFSSALLRS